MKTLSLWKGIVNEPRISFLFIDKKTATVATIAVILAGLPFYALTRPCVIGKCNALSQAKLINDRVALATLSSPTNGVLLTAYQQLQDSEKILESIPVWSRFYKTAQDELQQQQQTSQELLEIINAVKLENRAQKTMAEAPLSSKQWQAVIQDWQNALGILNIFPENKVFSPIIQRKKQEYKQNLAKSEEKLAQERQASSDLRSAEQAAQLAKVRESKAEKPLDWSLVGATWQAAILRLQQIPSETTIYPAAKQNLAFYIPQLIRIQKQQQRVASALNNFKQAQRHGKSAETAEYNKQWEEAVSQWRKAVITLKQIPTTSPQWQKAEPLMIFYTLSLKKAESALNQQRQTNRIGQELEGVCLGVVRICNYAIAENLIQIQLTTNYLQNLSRSSSNARNQGSFQTQIQILNHISQLDNRLQNISNFAGKRMEMFNANGYLMSVYEPR